MYVHWRYKYNMIYRLRASSAYKSMVIKKKNTIYAKPPAIVWSYNVPYSKFEFVDLSVTECTRKGENKAEQTNSIIVHMCRLLNNGLSSNATYFSDGD